MSGAQISNISASDLDEETREKLKGDVIGDTLYSQTFVIKTLMNLYDPKCTKEAEEDLCFLWDMTIEKDVCKFLFQLQYPSLASTALASCSEPRFIEILVGILANILLAECEEKDVAQTCIKLVLNELETDDSEVLLQLMRFIEAIAYALPQYINLLDNEVIEKRMQFVLKYSENHDLIIQTMLALVRLTENLKLDAKEVTSSLLHASVEGFETIFSKNCDNIQQEINMEDTKRIKVFLNLLDNICNYARIYPQEDDKTESIPSAINQSEKLSSIMGNIFRYFSQENYLFPISPAFDECVSTYIVILNTVEVLSSNLFKRTFTQLCKILYLLHSSKSEVLESFNLVLELIGSIICVMDQDVVLFELKHVRYKRGVVVLNSLKESLRTFEFDISDKIKYLFSEFK